MQSFPVPSTSPVSYCTYELRVEKMTCVHGVNCDDAIPAIRLMSINLVTALNEHKEHEVREEISQGMGKGFSSCSSPG